MRFLMVVWSVVCFQSLPLDAGGVELDSKSKIEGLIKGFEQKFGVNQITAEDVMQLQKKKAKVVLVDVRERSEMTTSMIPGAISKQQFEKEKDKYRASKVVSYCTIGYRSSAYVKSLTSQGFDAVNLRGSILLWAHAGGALVDLKGSQTKKVHVYGTKWNLLPSGYVGVTDHD